MLIFILWIVHIVVLFTFFPLLLITIPLHLLIARWKRQDEIDLLVAKKLFEAQNK